MPPLTIMLKPVSGACNLHCTYCFYRDVSQQREMQSFGIMSYTTLDALVRKAFAYADQALFFVFQGGEPMLAGLAFYREALRLQRRYNGRGLSISNAIQTNGTLLNDEWSQFFSENHFLVGVSLDGTCKLNDLYRVDALCNGTSESVLKGIALLQKHFVSFNILCVVTNDVAQHAHEVLEALRGYENLQFIPCLNTLDGTGGAYSLSAEAYGKFLVQSYQVYENAYHNGHYVSIRNFDNYLLLLMGRQPEMCAMQGACGQYYYLVEADGSVYPCDFYVLDEWYIGNINTSSFVKLSQSKVGARFVESSRKVSEQCLACKWFGLCRGGCRRDRLTTIDTALSQNRFCQSYQYFFSICAKNMNILAKELATKVQK